MPIEVCKDIITCLICVHTFVVLWKGIKTYYLSISITNGVDIFHVAFYRGFVLCMLSIFLSLLMVRNL